MKDFQFTSTNLDVIFPRLYAVCKERGFSLVVVPSENRMSILDCQGDIISRIKFYEESEVADLLYQLQEFHFNEEEI